MGQTITSLNHMVSYAGDLRRQAREAQTPDLAAKLQQSATKLETEAFTKAGIDNPKIGKLLDTFA